MERYEKPMKLLDSINNQIELDLYFCLDVFSIPTQRIIDNIRNYKKTRRFLMTIMSASSLAHFVN